MDRYQKVEKPKPESPINENEIRITTQGAIRNYITYAITLLQEKHAREIILKAMGLAISKTVAIAEILKSKVPRLYQDTAISSVSITDVWEPIEEGLVPVEMTRHVSMISITLSTKELNKTSPGYQAPLDTEQVKPQSTYHQQAPPRQGRGFYNAVNNDSYGRGRGRGRERGGRGRGRNNWGRGGYSNYQGDYGNYQGGYDNYQGGYDNYQGDYDNYQGGSDNYQGGYDNYQGGYGNYRGGYGNYRGGYGNYQDNGGYSSRGRGGGRGRGWGSRGAGYERGRGGGRGYMRGSRGRGGRSRGGGGNQG